MGDATDPSPAAPAQENAPRDAREMLARAREFLARKELAEARLEAELLVAHALGLDRLQLYMQLDRPVNAGEIARARELLVRRGKREPVAYLTGRREFYGRAFAVTRDVLIPRPETELLVDLARERVGAGAARIADIGTGSGCIAITLALELEASTVHAVDVSEPALELARANAQRLGANVRFVLGDGPRALLEAGAPEVAFDMIVSNPPYIAPEERAELVPEVRDFEPPLALYTPAGDAQHWTRRLLDEAVPMLRPGGRLLVELGRGRAQGALALAQERGLDARVHDDLARIPRVLEIAARGETLAPALRRRDP